MLHARAAMLAGCAAAAVLVGTNSGPPPAFDPALEYNPDPTLATAANFSITRSAIAANKWTAAAQTAPFLNLGGTNSAVTTAPLKAGTYRFAFTVSNYTVGNSMSCILDLGGQNATNSVVISGGNGSYTCDVVLPLDATFNLFGLHGSAGSNTWNITPISLKRIA